MKNKILLVCGSLMLIIFLVFGTYFWYLYFLRVNNISSSTTTTQDVGGITLIDNGKNVYDSDATTTNPDNVENIDAYVFNVKNDTNKNGSYTLYLEDVPINSVKDGCTEETLLKRNQLRYQLILDEQVIKEDDLENIKDNVLDTRTIIPNSTNHYKLRVYIKEDAENWTNKHYHYKVSIKKNR